jgi:hypothetical protein
MECGHVINLIAAWEFAGIVPHAVAAPAVIDVKFVQVIPPVTHTPFFEHLLYQLNHVSRVIRPVVAAIDQQDIELFTIIPELLLLSQI